MIYDLITGLIYAGVGIAALITLCVLIGKLAGRFSSYNDIK
jgi:hypothetical protein